MKKYIILICSFVVAIGMTTCLDEGMDFDTNGGKGKDFVHFNVKELGISCELVEVNTALHSRTILVSSTFKSDAARSYTLALSPSSSAVDGKHFTLSSKTVTIPAGQHTGSVTLTVISENLLKKAVEAVFTINSDEAISWGNTLKVAMNRYDLCDFAPSMLVGKFNYESKTWAEMGSLTLEADPDDPYKIYILGIPTEGLTWNGNKILLNLEPWAEGKTQLALSGPKTIVAVDTHQWGPDDTYDDFAFEALSGYYRICEEDFIINFRLSVKQGTFGTYAFTFKK